MKDNDRFECLNCRSRIAPQPVLQGCQDLYLATPFQVDYVKCYECGLVQVSSIPQDVSLYYQAYHPGVMGSEVVWKKMARSRRPQAHQLPAQIRR
jgi:ferredoxin-like protein FixX